MRRKVMSKQEESSANGMRRKVMSKQQERIFQDMCREANGLPPVGLKVRIGTHNALQPAHVLRSNSVVLPPPSS